MENLEKFVDLLKEEVCTIGDTRFGFVNSNSRNLNTVDFSFRLGTMYGYFNLSLDDLDSDDLLIMKYNAAKLVDKAYNYLIRKIKYDYRHILVDLVDIIKDVVEKSPINDFEVTGVEYFQTTAKVNFKIFGFDEHYEIDLGVMETFDTARLYASYVASRVISKGTDDMIYEYKKGCRL